MDSKKEPKNLKEEEEKPEEQSNDSDKSPAIVLKVSKGKIDLEEKNVDLKEFPTDFEDSFSPVMSGGESVLMVYSTEEPGALHYSTITASRTFAHRTLITWSLFLNQLSPGGGVTRSLNQIYFSEAQIFNLIYILIHKICLNVS